jgi:hypothetical protein
MKLKEEEEGAKKQKVKIAAMRSLRARTKEERDGDEREVR